MGKLGKREIIILSILLLVVLYAAYDFLVPKKRGATSTVTTAQRTAELNAFVNDLTARVSAGNIKNAPYLIFSRAEKEWKQDPFLDPKMYQVLKKLKEPSQFATTGKTPKNDFTYTGYIEADKVKVAVINGVEYREGEELDVKGFFVKNIGKGRVLIENRVTGVVKKIPLEE